jgi:hypothetical protein
LIDQEAAMARHSQRLLPVWNLVVSVIVSTLMFFRLASARSPFAMARDPAAERAAAEDSWEDR